MPGYQLINRIKIVLNLVLSGKNLLFSSNIIYDFINGG